METPKTILTSEYSKKRTQCQVTYTLYNMRKRLENLVIRAKGGILILGRKRDQKTTTLWERKS